MTNFEIIVIFIFMLSCCILHSVDSWKINDLNKRTKKLEKEIKELNKYLVPCTEMIKEVDT